MELGKLIQERGVKGLKTVAGATKRITALPALAAVTYTIVTLPDGTFVPVIFLKREEMHLALAAHEGVFVMGA